MTAPNADGESQVVEALEESLEYWQVRRAIKSSGLSRYRIAIEADVDQASLSRFMHGEGISTTTLDAVAKVLRIRLKVDGPTAALLKKYGK